MSEILIEREKRKVIKEIKKIDGWRRMKVDERMWNSVIERKMSGKEKIEIEGMEKIGKEIEREIEKGKEIESCGIEVKKSSEDIKEIGRVIKGKIKLIRKSIGEIEVESDIIKIVIIGNERGFVVI